MTRTEPLTREEIHKLAIELADKAEAFGLKCIVSLAQTEGDIFYSSQWRGNHLEVVGLYEMTGVSVRNNMGIAHLPLGPQKVPSGAS